MKSAGLILKTDWKELNITNSEGRKAYILLELEELKKEILEIKSKVLTVEYDLKSLYRNLDYLIGV